MAAAVAVTMPPETTTVATAGYVGWEEVFVCSEKGRREIHYVLKRKDGGSDLAVVAKERSSRHMTCRFLLAFPSVVKSRSRREVLDWLNSFIQDSPTRDSPCRSSGLTDGNEADELDSVTLKDTQLQKLGHNMKEFLWLGSAWTCKKRRKHYQAFCRNGIKISVNGFVHVLAEETKQLVAYLDDMYEDSKGNKMVVVQWFHRNDEVGVDLPRNFNDREIFFSLCLQDLSIECIDGPATVLSPQHYVKFLNETKHTQLDPYVCHRQYDNDDIKPLDITQVKGYWKQDIVRHMFSLHSSRGLEKTCLPDDYQENVNDFSGIKPRKRLRLSRDCKVELQCATVKGAVAADDVNGQNSVGLAARPVATVCRKEFNMDVVPQSIVVGTEVEVLSQDSGIRGCWFRATVIKKHKNKVKLRYHDINDAENEANCLEEWVLASRIPVHDSMGLRLHGRTTIRPPMWTHNGKVSWVINVGSIVDAWWHDGWWEGIVIQKESEEKFRVYFPGEKREAGFCRTDLRHSREWIGGTWKELSERPDIAGSILSDLVKEARAGKTSNDKQLEILVCDDKQLECDIGNYNSCGAQDGPSNLHIDSAHSKPNSPAVVDLLKDDFLSQLKWKSSRKRSRSGFFMQKLQCCGSNRMQPLERHQKFLIPSKLKVEKDGCKSAKDNCKYITDPLFISSVVPTLTSLVMSR